METGSIEAIVRVAVSAIKDVGFPAFVAGYLLVKIGPAIDALTKAINDLREVNQVAAGFCRRRDDPKP